MLLAGTGSHNPAGTAQLSPQGCSMLRRVDGVFVGCLTRTRVDTRDIRGQMLRDAAASHAAPYIKVLLNCSWALEPGRWSACCMLWACILVVEQLLLNAELSSG
jgi:hypothetical protein